MEMILESVSPIAYELIREGMILKISKKIPNKLEYRGTLEPAKMRYLAFSGITKVGMIPDTYTDEIILKKIHSIKIIKINRSPNQIVAVLIIKKN